MTEHHEQGFFFGWNWFNLASSHLREFWAGLTDLREKSDVNLNFESGIAHLSPNLPDQTQQIVFGFQQTLGCGSGRPVRGQPHTPRMQATSRGRVPLVKAQLLRDGVEKVDIAGWATYCAAQGAEIEAMHRSIEVSCINRLGIRPISTELADG